MSKLSELRDKLACEYEPNIEVERQAYSDGFDAGAKAVMVEAEKLAEALDLVETYHGETVMGKQALASWQAFVKGADQ